MQSQIAKIFDDEIFVIDIDELPPLVFVQIFSKKENSICLNMHIFEDTIHVKTLIKCSSGTGSELLNKLHELAMAIPGITRIELVDVSKRQICSIDIDLAFLSILTSGVSWYNHHGYISQEHQMNARHNQMVINQPFVVIMQNIRDKKKQEVLAQSDSDDSDDSYSDDSDSDSDDSDDSDHRPFKSNPSVYQDDLMREQDLKYDQFMEELNAIVPIASDITVKDYVQHVLNSIGKHDCSKENAILLNKLVNFMSSAIKYNRLLSLSLPNSKKNRGAGRKGKTRFIKHNYKHKRKTSIKINN